MKVKFTYKPTLAIDTLYGGQQIIQVQGHTTGFPIELTAGSTVCVPCSVGDWEIIQDQVRGGLIGQIPGSSPAKYYHGVKVELVEDDETTAGDYGTCWCDKCAGSNVEFVKCSNGTGGVAPTGDLAKAMQNDWLDPGSTIFCVGTGKLYELDSAFDWIEMA